MNRIFKLALILIGAVSQPALATNQRFSISTTTYSAHGMVSTITVGECKLDSRLPAGILTLLHGRGGHKTLHSLVRSFEDFACQRNFLIVAPAAPTANNNWPFEKRNGERQDLFLVELLKHKSAEIFKSGKQKKFYLVGISAGATFLMGDFYPRHAHMFKGLAAAFCGGSAPTQASITQMRTVESDFPLFVQISSKDFLFPQVESGLRRYEKLGLPLRAKITHEPGHCAFDFSKSLELIARKIQE